MRWPEHEHALTVVGAVLVLFSLVAYAARPAGEVLGFTVLGVVCLILGPVIDRLEEASISPASGRFRLGPTRERTLALATTEGTSVPEAPEAPWLVERARVALASESLGRLTDPDESPALPGCRIKLFLYDADVDALVPVAGASDSSGGPGDRWTVGVGATGTAYSTGGFVLATGEQVWDTTYGLTEEQSELFKTLTAVAAMPVVNASDEVIAVLTATTEEPEGGILVTTDGYGDLLERALLLARVLVDVLQWFPDEYGGG